MRSELVDVLIVGAGPAGLSAAVNAASEGLTTLVLDSEPDIGGQAKFSARVENYPGFTNGISGQKLVQRMAHQARRFHAQIITGTHITKLFPEGELFAAVLSDGRLVVTRVLVACCGLMWRKLNVAGADRLLHKGVYYGAMPSEAVEYRGRHIAVVGGANSALQAALNFAEQEASVDLLVREPELNGSDYLVDRADKFSNIKVHYSTEVQEFVGNGQLERVALSDGSSINVSAVFIFIGSEPRTEWLAAHCACDERGYLLIDNTGMTSKPGIFAAGDVVSGSTKRIAAAGGAGANVVQHIHEYLDHSAIGRAA